jgi:GrpB-like predicted nucleotidyltransferase (UPF0157 family)
MLAGVSGTRGIPSSLLERLLAAGAQLDADPFEVWARLRRAEGERATVIDLYALVAGARGLEPHDLPREERLALARRGQAIIWPGFESTADSERDFEPVEIADYDDEWPRRFAAWRERLAAALGSTAIRIEHVGSTSVPGLDAKDTVDIQVSVHDIEDETAYVPPIEAAGAQLRSRDELHRYFRPFAGQQRVVHVHVCNSGSEWERGHLLFRDYLRAHPPACVAYAEMKRRVATIWRDDRIGYTDAKSELIIELQRAGEAWAAEVLWSVGPPGGPTSGGRLHSAGEARP